MFLVSFGRSFGFQNPFQIRAHVLTILGSFLHPPPARPGGEPKSSKNRQNLGVPFYLSFDTVWPPFGSHLPPRGAPSWIAEGIQTSKGPLSTPNYPSKSLNLIISTAPNQFSFQNNDQSCPNGDQSLKREQNHSKFARVSVSGVGVGCRCRVSGGVGQLL